MQVPETFMVENIVEGKDMEVIELLRGVNKYDDVLRQLPVLSVVYSFAILLGMVGVDHNKGA